MAQLVTLSGTYNPTAFTCSGCEYLPARGARRNPRDEELMAGWWTDLKRSKVGRMVTSATHDTPLAYAWRPSKTSGWMAPVGGVLLTLGAIPSPASPFLLGGGAAMTAVGGAGELYRTKDLEDKQKRAITAHNFAVEQKTKKQTKYMWIGASLLGLTAAYMAVK